MKSLTQRVLSVAVTSIVSFSSFSYAQSGQSCNWYGSSFPVCANQNWGWGWENSASCISANECSNAGQTIEASNINDCSATSITPYLLQPGGHWRQRSSTTVGTGDVIVFGPQPTRGGLWNWTGCGTNGNSREQIIAPTSSCIATTTFTNNCGITSSQNYNITVNDGSNNSCNTSAITPYVKTDGAWIQSAIASVTSGKKITLGPQPIKDGHWSWSGCGTTADSRELTIRPTSSCSINATYTNSCGAQSTQTFNIRVATNDSDDESCTAPTDELMWGTNYNGNEAPDLNFISTWVGYEHTQNRAYQCDGCRIAGKLANTNTYAVYYAYFIGFALPDCNVQPEGGNLCTHGAQWVRNNYAYLLGLYRDYAAQTYNASPNKSVYWLLEGDYHQLTTSSQINPLSLTELGQLAADITQAIKNSAPNSKVAMNHSTWLSNEETVAFWKAMPLDQLDFVWTTGVGNNNGYFNSDTNSSSYNGYTARYDFISALTGKKIFVDTSFGLSQAKDSWTTLSADTLRSRIKEGIFSINVTTAPKNYKNKINTLAPQLRKGCK